MDVQLQKGGSHCGLFSIATATALCNGQNPVYFEYSQKSMRNHLLKAFEAKAHHPFPGKIIKKCNEIIGRESIRVYCKCRLPDDGRKIINCMDCKLCRGIMWIVLSVPKQHYKKMYRGIVKLVYTYLLVLIINYLIIYNYQ